MADYIPYTGSTALKINPIPSFANSTLGSAFSIGSSGTPALNGTSLSPTNTNSNVTTANALTSAFLPSTLKPTTNGGTFIGPQAAAGYTPAPSTPAPAPKSSLSSFITGSQPTPNGGTVQTTGGQPSGYSAPPTYSINTSNIPSDAITNNTSMGDIAQSHSSYSDYVNALAQAQGYSPDYINAQSGVYNAQATGAQLGVNQAAYGNQAFGSNQANNGAGLNYGNLGGATTDYVAGTIGSEQSSNAIKQAQNTQQQTQASIALNAAQLQRTGNIAAAQTQLQYNPTAVSSENAISQYNTLQQQYPNAAIPEYNTALSPATNQQIAQELVSNSPAYRSQFQSTYQTPGGGTGIYSKLDVGSGGFQQNQDGSYTLVPAAAAALGSANANVVSTQLNNLSNINSAVSASQRTLQTTQQFMNQYGLNQSGVSILSQIQNSTNKQLDKAGAVAGLNADLNALRADYAQYLVGRGGSVSGTNEEAQQAIPDTISPSQLQTLVTQMQTDGQNAADAVSGQVNAALQGISGNTVPTNTSTGSGWASLGD